MSEPLREIEDGDVSEETREANERIAAKALRLRFAARIPFVCECRDPDCREFVLLRPAEYAERRRSGHGYVMLPGHAIADGVG